MPRAKEKYKKIIKKCVVCNKEYKCFPYQEKTSKFCSFSCHGKVARKGIKITEEHKQKLQEGRKKFFYTPKVKQKMSEIKKNQYQNGIKSWNTGKSVKSNNALDEYRKKNNGMFGENHPQWKGGLNPMWIRKQRLKINGGFHTLNEWETLKAQYNFTCPSCKKQKPLTKDHIIPITKGGSDNIENIQPLCQSCNSKKHKQEIKFEY